MYKHAVEGVRVLLVHPGGPFWLKRDIGAWSIPKGEFDEGEDPLVVARREFEEETGLCPSGEVVPLGEIRQVGGKHVVAFALEGEFDVATLVSNTFEIEWPPRSGHTRAFPEVDRAEWLSIADAHAKIIPGQRLFLDRLRERLAAHG